MPPKDQEQNKDKNKIQSEIDEQIIHLVSPFAEPEKKHYVPNPDLKALRTFQGDVEETIHNKKTSVAKVFVAEQESKKKPELELPQKRSGSIFLTHGILPLVGVVLFVSGAITLVTIYYNIASNSAPIKVILDNSLVPYTDKMALDLPKPVDILNREQILKTLSDKKNTYNKSVGSVLYLQFLYNKTELSSVEFFQNIAATAPPSLARSFGEKYMSGIYSFDTNEVFLLLSTDDYGITYAGMLKWENSMANDLSLLFPNTPTLSAGLDTTIFKDDSFNNQDVRILRNSSGQIGLVYGFIDKNILVITANEKIYQALVNKYRNSKLVR